MPVAAQLFVVDDEAVNEKDEVQDSPQGSSRIAMSPLICSRTSLRNFLRYLASAKV
jgi:hypothetical protein